MGHWRIRVPGVTSLVLPLVQTGQFTRLTNAFSKKVDNHRAAVALYFVYYNFGRVHQTIRVTPAMEAGIANHVWSVEEIVALLDRE